MSTKDQETVMKEIAKKVTVLFDAFHDTALSFRQTHDPDDIIMAQAFYLRASLLSFKKVYSPETSQALHEIVVEIMSTSPKDL